MYWSLYSLCLEFQKLGLIHTYPHTPGGTFPLWLLSFSALPLMSISFDFTKCNCTGPTAFACTHRRKASSFCWLASEQCDGTLYKFRLPSQRPLEHSHSADFTGETVDVWRDYMTCQSLPSYKGFPDSSVVKNLPAEQGTWVRSLGWEDPLESEMATHSSILAWRIPWTEDPSGQSRTWLSTQRSHTMALSLDRCAQVRTLSQ